ncbi:ABC transporter ATP-binding protein [Cellulomonas fimi]|uniref:ABC transporter related protein n=1 Tax=Cellulomonas fimi (strain ATCC 484 / DSM 20113 / JCM 1341 / CCUG 24087 / LMG 16345 / NBRC 15513 / NCIMB 8980 / NCTC 7547 / NRS-133) TaxID=590998 RepID=F4H8P4_CELFA|nr:ATP-binding cassette domain-containing protein [Cellulomonas fimi]AEE47052.1 ABC transporter related protein [Cellulomonas fimi ATCC 484]NNH07794.1 ATP-binding cassette domain-containing protein [Cellulomonas fimi]VEH34969.1 Lipoprotein-releasing system ATP-binding protein LolD [Cellulomonas fimi]
MHLVADDVYVRYRKTSRDVLAGACLRVAQGETIAVLGPSGSGKSTLLSVLGGLVAPTRGSAHLDHAERQSLRDVTAWVLQTVNVLPERSALDNAAIAGLTRGMSHAAARKEAQVRLSDVGLGDRLDDAAKVLSGGELQRVVIARALMSARPFILADEPTGQLDRATSDIVLDALFHSAAGAAVVVVTHDRAVAERCNRVVRIHDGVVRPA